MSATAFQRMRRDQEAKKILKEQAQNQDKKLEDMKVPELKEIAKEKGIPGYANMKKEELLKALLETEKPGDNEDKGEPEKPQNEESKEPKGAE